MQFEEFLLGLGEDQLCRFLASYDVGTDIPAPIHARLMDFVTQFCLVGGMPEAVATYQKTGSLQQVDAIKRNVLTAYTDDFAKYQPRIHYDRMITVLRQVPLMIGEKVKYVNIDPHARSKDLAESLTLLSMGRVIHRVFHSACNGVPLGADVNEKFFKFLFLDVGLVSTACGFTLLDYEKAGDVLLVNQGKISEQFVGQHLLDVRPPYAMPELYYWAREQKSASAEVDYVMAIGSYVMPVEIKAGKTGSLKSLQQFVREKNRPLGVRICSQHPSLTEARTSIPGANNVPFRLLSLPFYLVGQLERLVRRPLAVTGSQ